MAKVALLFSSLHFLMLTLFTEPTVGGSLEPFSPIESPMPNFYAIDVLDDGQKERRFFLDGIALKEKPPSTLLTEPKWGQMTDGRHMIQLIYDANQSLQDCEYVTDVETAGDFIKSLAIEYRQLSSNTSTGRFRLIESRSDLPEDLARIAVYSRLKVEFRQLHNRIRKVFHESQNPSSKRYELS